MRKPRISGTYRSARRNLAIRVNHTVWRRGAAPMVDCSWAPDHTYKPKRIRGLVYSAYGARQKARLFLTPERFTA